MVTPYIVFNGLCADALAFYSKVFAVEISMRQPYGEYIPEGSAVSPEILSKWILHAEMEIAGTTFWFADDVNKVNTGGMVKLTVRVPDGNTARAVFDGLSSGGEVTLPPTETFYSSFHASATDKYGVCWNIVADEPPQKPDT